MKNIQIDIHEYNSITLEELVSQNKLDFALMHTSKQLDIHTNSNINIDILNQDPIVVVTKKNSALASYGQHNGDFIYPTISPEYLEHQRFIMLIKRVEIQINCISTLSSRICLQYYYFALISMFTVLSLVSYINIYSTISSLLY